jgi:DNA primase
MLIAIHQHAERFFQAHHSHSWVPGYLKDRGFDTAAQQQWAAGYAPDEWRALTNHLRSLGFGDTAIEASGLARRTTRKTLVDFFRDRAMFPIKDPDGTTIAFIGRSRNGDPKYLNSPHTPIYAKGQTLFGLHAITTDSTPVITEGPLDAMAITAVGQGRFTGLSPCGTALTPDQVAALSLVTDLSTSGVVIAFDSDRAGQHAAVRAYALFTDICTAGAIVLPHGQDPAGVLRDTGPASLATLLSKQVRPLADLVTDAAIEPWRQSLDYAEGRHNALRAAGKAIAAMPPQDVPRQVARVAARLNFDYAMVTETTVDAVSARLAMSDFPLPPITGNATAGHMGRKPNERPPRGPTP